jgi:hypothetical protein
MDGNKYSAIKLNLANLPEAFQSLMEVLKANIIRDDGDPISPSFTHFGFVSKSAAKIVSKVAVDGFDNSYIQYIGYALLGNTYAPIMIGKLYDFNGSNYTTAILTAPFNNEPYMYITGSVPQLGMWNGENPLQMTLGYSRGGLYWYVYIPALIGKEIEYKYLYEPGKWQDGDNQKYTPTQGY